MANANDLIQLNARVSLADNQIAENVFFVRTGDAYDDGDLKTACIEYLDEIYENLAGYQSVSVDALDILFRNITAGTPTETLEWDNYVGGTSSSAAQLPPGVAALVTATTAVAKAIGRKYFAGLVGDAWGGAGWIAPVMTALALAGLDWIESFSDSINGVQLQPVLRRSAGGVTTNFTEAIARSEAGYQRRRREGVGD